MAFLMRYSKAVITRVKPLRRRRIVSQSVALVNPPAAGEPQPTAYNDMFTMPHALVDMGAVASEIRKAKAKAQKLPLTRIKRVARCNGKCAKDGCKKQPKRTPYRCGACRGGCGAYWHLQCFFEAHPPVGPPRP